MVADLVDGVSKLDQIQFKNRQEAQAESFRKMLFAMVRDIRVIMVKLADRMHNMRTLGVMPPMKRRRIARETLEIYAPIAERLGLYAVKLELEDLGFRALYPYRYRVLERELKRARGNQKQFLSKIEETFKAALVKAEITAHVEGREKHLYSIYKKMENKHISLNEMVDVYGFRIIVDNVDTCYRVLGLVHGVYRPMPGRFKDYIAIPRINGYQSLHTTLFGPNGVPIEAQIRSEQMHRVAESGIAAHWKYKSGGDSFGGIEHDRAREWLAGLVQIQEGGSSEEFLESVKVDLFPDKVLHFHAEGQDPAAADRRDGGGFRLRHPHRRRQPLRRRQGRPAARAAAHAAAQRSDRRDHHGQGGDAESLLVELPGHRQGACRDPPVPQELEARRSDRARHGGCLGLALEELSLNLKKIPAADIDAVVKELNLKDADELFEKIGLGERLAALVARHLQPARDGAASASSGPSDDRGHRRAARHLRALLLSHSRTIPSWRISPPAAV